ncbi:tRNA (adenine(22)-N(1))-methyltransferase [Alicyclobacillus dauci]|uniref:Class I SAM-dependent methyltransferase n=1 Tax=Alicyclobacillus dauci TaxID=1475485 RepID=A0ABY6Z6N4_9BACL|nr:class I SAM-dependent methyltransferase [Alicyclobacillus dauci]WAH38558.1 class I SAM-dependent methyltransferase [Alicyclobacillus dauci]
MQPITLSKRMQKIVEHIPKCESLADIGTDHAFIPIHTVQTKRALHAIATDLREGPLRKARENVNRHGLKELIELRLGNGFQPIRPGEVDVIVSAGIGGHVHTQMLDESPKVTQSVSTIIFQPMNAGHLLRSRLDELHFTLSSEALVLDDDRIYEIIIATPNAHRDPAYDPYRDDPSRLMLAYTYGPLLLRDPDELFHMRLEREINKLRAVQHSVQTSDNLEARERFDTLQAEIEQLLALQVETRGGKPLD